MRMRMLLAVLLAWVLGGAALARQPEDPVSVRGVAQMKKVHAGDQFAVAVVIDLKEHWHIWPTELKGKLPDGVTGLDPEWTYVGPERSEDETAKRVQPPSMVVGTGFKAYPGGMQWPEPVKVTSAGFTGTPLTLLSYAKQAVVFVPIVVDVDAKPGVQTLEWSAYYQACDESVCMQPTAAPVAVSWEIVGNDVPVVTGDEADLFKAFDGRVFGTLGNLTSQKPTPTAKPKATSHSFDFLGYSFTLGSNQYVLIFLIAFVAGFLLNLTPCVLPVIPIKVMSLQKQASNPTKLILYGTVYCIGILAMFGGLGVLIAFAHQQWGQMFSSPWFVVAMGIVVLVMGIGMMGFFTIQLPKAVYMVNPAGDSIQGNFMLGVLTAILSTPCTGPFLGAVLAWAATRPSWVGFTTLVVMGAGMAFPYALLIVFPKLIDKMPRSGPGGELLKQVMGGLMLAVAGFLFSNLVHEKWPWWIIGGIGAASFLWAIIGGARMLRTMRSKVIVTVISLFGIVGSAGLGYAMTRPSGIPWKEFYKTAKGEGVIQKAIDEGKNGGKFVVVKFTATWCVNCHIIEESVFNSGTGIKLMNRSDVVAIKVDLTRGNEEGWELLEKMSGGTGIPFSVFYRPGGEPVAFRSFFKISDMEKALDRKTAKGA